MTWSPERLLDEIDQLPVSTAVSRGLRSAERAGEADFVKWCRLELAGYYGSNPAMTEDVVVPSYRTVAGQHADIYGRVLLLEPGLSFVGETRLRNGLEELESLARTRDTVMIHDSHMCDLIRTHLQVEVYSFHFSSVLLTGVFAAVREELRRRLGACRTVEVRRGSPSTTDAADSEDILELKPNFFGIGVNLRAIWKRWKGAE